MRKTRIKSVYHWFIMSLVMGMPLLLTLLSSIPNAYNDNNVVEYETSDYIKSTSLIVDRNYKYEFNYPSGLFELNVSNVDDSNVGGNRSIYTGSMNGIISNGTTLYYYNADLDFIISNPTGYFTFDFKSTNNVGEVLKNTYVLETTTHEVINNSAYQVWQFNQKFMSIPINSWYHDLMELTIGVPSEYSPMNNMVVFPLYGVWVLLFDLVFDCLAFIPNLCHNWLEKLGGDRE